MKKRCTAMLIVLAMLFTMLPGTAYAADFEAKQYMDGLYDGKAVLGRTVSFIPEDIIGGNAELSELYLDGGYTITCYIYNASEAECYNHVFTTDLDKPAVYTLPKMLEAVDLGFNVFFQFENGSNSLVFKSDRIETVADIADLQVNLVSKTYTGKPIKQSLGTITYTKPYMPKIVYSEGTDYTVVYKNNTNAGTASVTLTGQGRFIGSVTKTFKINKAANLMTVQNKTVKVKESKLKKKKQVIKCSESMGICTAVGKLQFKLEKVNKKKFKKYFKVNANNGKITIKKGLKKGTYKLKINVTAAGNANYLAASRQVTVTIKVK